MGSSLVGLTEERGVVLDEVRRDERRAVAAERDDQVRVSHVLSRDLRAHHARRGRDPHVSQERRDPIDLMHEGRSEQNAMSGRS